MSQPPNHTNQLPVRATNSPLSSQLSSQNAVSLSESVLFQSEFSKSTVASKLGSWRSCVGAQVLLGGMFTSRLNQNLREQHGYTYGSQALLTRLAESGYFIAQAALRSDVTVEGLTETLHELQRITQQQMTVAEAQKGQKAALQHLVAQGERAAGLSQLYATLVRYSLPLDELSRLGRSVLLATPAQLLRVAKSEIRPSEATIVLVGDVKKLEPLLRKLPGLQAAPQYRDLDGNAQ